VLPTQVAPDASLNIGCVAPQLTDACRFASRAIEA
jgi:hypothetical protein